MSCCYYWLNEILRMIKVTMYSILLMIACYNMIITAIITAARTQTLDTTSAFLNIIYEGCSQTRFLRCCVIR